MTSQSTSHGTRLSLLERARARDSGAWRELLDLYAPLVAYWCRRCGLDSHTTADCIQNVFTAVAGNLGTYRPQSANGAFRGWLWTISRNKIRDLIRAQAHQPRAVGGSSAWQALAQIPADASATDDQPSDMDQLEDLARRGLEQVRGEFEPQTWQAFWRTAIDGIPTAIVAGELGVTAAAIRQSRSRILRRLRQQLGDLDAGP